MAQGRTTQTNEKNEPAGGPGRSVGSASTPTPSTPGPTVGSGTSQASALPQALQGRYRLIRVLGKGGFANVYLAHDSALDQDVAIKVLKLGLASASEQDRFLFEARTGAKLRHPNIISVLDIIQSPEGLQMIMEYCPGGTLSDRVKAKGPLRPLQAIDMTRQVGHALGHAHRRNFVHRDVKPANIFMAADGLVKLGDFGIAAYTDLHEFTQTGMIIGTPLYMAPEQASDSRSVDPRADVYSLGLMLYYALTGKSPRVLDLDLLPLPFRALIKQATRQERNERLPSCDQFIAVLDKIQAELKSGGELKSVPISAELPPAQILEPDPEPADSQPPSLPDVAEEKAEISTETRAREATDKVSAATISSPPMPAMAPVRAEKTIKLSSVLLFAAGGAVALVAAMLIVPLFQQPAGEGPSINQPGQTSASNANASTVVAAVPTQSPTPAPTATPEPTPTTTPTATVVAAPAQTPAQTPTPANTPPPPEPSPTPALIDGIFYPLDTLVGDMLKNPAGHDRMLVTSLQFWNDAARELRNNKSGSATIPLNMARTTLEQAMQDAAAPLRRNQFALMLLGLIYLRQNNATLAAPWIQEAYRLNRPGTGTSLDFRPETLQRVFELTPAEVEAVRRLHPGPLRPGMQPGQQPFQNQPPQRPQQQKQPQRQNRPQNR